MNNLRRKTLSDIYDIITEAKDNLDAVRDEEEEYKDNMPENLQNSERYEKIVVLSMYDGIGTGRYCLDKMGFKNVEYYAFEIDKFAMQIANDNYSDIIQCGDAFQMRDNDFNLNGLLMEADNER